MSELRLIGDVHGRYDQYLELIKNSEYSLQVGDLGFSYDQLNHLDFTRHRAIQGNHDNYGIERHNIFLGDYGVHSFGNIELFYVRGAWSIDWTRRVSGYSWWPEEELSLEEGEKALALYKELKPRIVVTHEAPHTCVKNVTDPKFAKWFGYSGVVETRTNQLLQKMLDFHQPDYWFFGHYHTSRKFKVPEADTLFFCLDMIRDQPTDCYADFSITIQEDENAVYVT